MASTVLLLLALVSAIGGAFLTQTNAWGGIAVIIVFGGGFGLLAAWLAKG